MTVPMIKTFSKSAVERRRLYLDYSCWLEESEKLTDMQVTTTPLTPDAPISINIAYTDVAQKKLLMYVGGGVANTDYRLSIVVQTDAAQIKRDDIGLRVI